MEEDYPRTLIEFEKRFSTGMSKNADLAHYFLPDFWTLEKLSKMPVINGLRGITWGPKIGQRKVTDLDGLV
jgi:hypothetical protein